MVVALTSGLAVLVCQGCTSTGDVPQYASEPAAPKSAGMAMAVPGPIGKGPIGVSSAASPVLSEVTMLSFRQPVSYIPLTEDNAPVAVSLFVGDAPAFDLSSGGASTSLSLANLGWAGSESLASLAAAIASGRTLEPSELVQSLSVGASFAASSARTGLGFDVGLAPRFGVRNEGDIRARTFGGEVRLGQGLNLLGRVAEPEGWYVFVGADGEALVWDADRSRFNMNALDQVQLTDQLTVGDLQAGVSVQRGGGQLSLSYIRREIRFEDRNGSMSDSEDFAGITFTMRR